MFMSTVWENGSQKPIWNTGVPYGTVQHWSGPGVGQSRFQASLTRKKPWLEMLLSPLQACLMEDQLSGILTVFDMTVRTPFSSPDIRHETREAVDCWRAARWKYTATLWTLNWNCFNFRSQPMPAIKKYLTLRRLVKPSMSSCTIRIQITLAHLWLRHLKARD